MSTSEQLTYCLTKIISYLSDETQSIEAGFFMSFNVNHKKMCNQLHNYHGHISH